MVSIRIPNNIKIQIYTNFIKITSPFGEIIKKKSSDIKLLQHKNNLYLLPNGTDNKSGMFFLNLVFKTINNLSKGCYKSLIIEGVGYRVSIDGSNLTFKLGFSHEILYTVPDNIQVYFKEPNILTIYGHNLQQVSQIAAEIRALRPPEPYKGKGIRYQDEVIIRKVGKVN